MIRLLNQDDRDALYELLENNTIVNYFIITALERSERADMFLKKWGEFDDSNKLTGVLLKRKTGNVQFYAIGEYDAESFSNILTTEGFRRVIGEERILEKLERSYRFSRKEKGSFIAAAKQINYREVDTAFSINKVEIRDIDKIIELYKLVFDGFAARESMIKKLLEGTGRGYYIEKCGKILSVAQSSYEKKDSAIIVGVATDPNHTGQGLATACLGKLCKELNEEGKNLYLQYDNEKAGNIYRRMGFHITGRMENLFA